jgi:hypothetical protein
MVMDVQYCSIYQIIFVEGYNWYFVVGIWHMARTHIQDLEARLNTLQSNFTETQQEVK